MYSDSLVELLFSQPFALLFGSKLRFSQIFDSLSSAHRMHDFTDFHQPHFTKFLTQAVTINRLLSHVTCPSWQKIEM